ncbi:MAG TPA: hypothetical protein VFY21_00145 [Xanthobacteraceae bacterium]|nr:hypothetical protein [Xanthobacteraceae bacterium]
MKKTLRLAIVAVLCAGFVAAADAADTKSERDKYGFYAPYFGHDPEDRYRFRTERRLPYARGALRTPNRLERDSYQYSRDGYRIR